MRFFLWFAIVLVVGLLAAAGVQAFVSHSANVDKENGYAVLKPPAASALVTKENGYAVLKPPAAAALVTKENGYAVLKPPSADALVSKVNLYAVISKSLPSVKILQ